MIFVKVVVDEREDIEARRHRIVSSRTFGAKTIAAGGRIPEDWIGYMTALRRQSLNSDVRTIRFIAGESNY